MKNLQDLATIKNQQPTIKTIHCTKHGDYQANSYNVMGRMMNDPCPKCKAEFENNFPESKTSIPWLSKRRSGMTLDTYRCDTPEQTEIFNKAVGYVDNFNNIKEVGSCLCFVGQVGTGKTHLATAMGVKLCENKHTVEYKGLSELMRSIKSTYSNANPLTEEEVLDRLLVFDMLIIDEIGLKTLTETETSLLYQIINNRYEAVKPTILVSNLSEEELGNHLGARTIDRMYENHGSFFVFDWESERRK